jgi:hypothetical protein
MSLIRPQASAVGAFEAQVFDMGKTYRTIMTQAAAQRKSQQDAKKEMDKMMANTYSTKGKGRLQDMPELEKQYQDLQNFYINNNSSILRGGKESLEFQKMRSAFIFEAEEANMRKERDKQLSPFFKMNLEKEGMSDKSTELMTIFNLPYNDQRRKDYRYEGADGQIHGIDELNVADIEKYRKFNEVDLMKTISTTAPIKKVKDLQIQPSESYNLPKGYSISVTGEYALRDPMTIAQAVTGELSAKPDARNFYGNMFKNESQENLQRASEEFKMFNQIYKAAGYTQFINTETDNQPGITNESEYAIYRNLKANLPQDLGQKISTQLLSAELGIKRLDLANRKWSNFIDVQSRSLPIDEAANRFLDTNPNDNQLQDFAFSESKLLRPTYGGGGGTLPADVKYFKPGTFDRSKHAPGLSSTGSPSYLDKNSGVLVYTTQKVALNPEDDTPVKSINDAREYYGDAYEYKINPKTKEVYMVESIVVPQKGISPAERGRLLKYGYLRASQSQSDNDAYNMLYKGLFQSGTGAVPEPGTNIQVGKGKGQRFRSGSSSSGRGM